MIVTELTWTANRKERPQVCVLTQSWRAAACTPTLS